MVEVVVCTGSVQPELLYTTGNEGFLYTHANALKDGRLVVQYGLKED